MMNLNVRRFAPTVAVGAFALVAGTMALADPPAPLPQVSVQAEREVEITRGDRVGTSSKHMGERITLTQEVDVSDLDPYTAADADEMQARIDAAAHDVCHQLRTLYPDGATDVPGYEHTNEDCVRDAVNGAREQLGTAAAVETDELTH